MYANFLKICLFENEITSLKVRPKYLETSCLGRRIGGFNSALKGWDSNFEVNIFSNVKSRYK